MHNDLHVSLDAAQKYGRYAQLLGIFSRTSLTDDEAFEKFLEVCAYFRTLELPDNFCPILAVEGANLTGGKLERVVRICQEGVRFMTLVWGGYTCIGGAHNDGRGLTEFGRAVADLCLQIGIVPDLSHASDATFWETIEIADRYQKPVVCTHSNSRAVRNHTRNLTDEMFTALVKRGGLAGISMVRSHLTDREECGIPEIAAHIEHYLSLGGENTVAMGCDLDGTRPLPDGLSGVGDIDKIAEYLARQNYSDALIDNIFWHNANNFMRRNGILQ